MQNSFKGKDPPKLKPVQAKKIFPGSISLLKAKMYLFKNDIISVFELLEDKQNLGEFFFDH